MRHGRMAVRFGGVFTGGRVVALVVVFSGGPVGLGGLFVMIGRFGMGRFRHGCSFVTHPAAREKRPIAEAGCKNCSIERTGTSALETARPCTADGAKTGAILITSVCQGHTEAGNPGWGARWVAVDVRRHLRRRSVKKPMVRRMVPREASDVWAGNGPAAVADTVVNQNNGLWRRGRDSNPRYPCEYAAFRVRCFQPLSHLSRPWGGTLFGPGERRRGP